jgi:glycosyltransferase A (GT-A) superfamily protein (DUF2064 family)
VSVGVLVLAKAPVPGLAKTRLAATVGAGPASELAAAALLDTLDTVRGWAPEGRRLVALTGDLAAAARGDEITAGLQGWAVVPQRGDTFAARLVHAHHDAADLWGPEVAVIQIGTDTPQLTCHDLQALADGLGHSQPSDQQIGSADGTEEAAVGDTTHLDAVLGPATDGGWWGLATRRAGYVDGLADVAMSTDQTAELTLSALRTAGARVMVAHPMSDVDVFTDALAVAQQAPNTGFALAVRALLVGAAA